MDIKGHSGEVSGRNEEPILDNGRKVICVIKRQITWPNCVLLFYGRENNETGYLAELISKQNFEGTDWVLLILTGQCERREMN